MLVWEDDQEVRGAVDVVIDAVCEEGAGEGFGDRLAIGISGEGVREGTPLLEGCEDGVSFSFGRRRTGLGGEVSVNEDGLAEGGDPADGFAPEGEGWRCVGKAVVGGRGGGRGESWIH